MSSIKSKGTKPEIIVRHFLWDRGFRYRINYKRLPGHPDIVLPKYRTCIFINGCFWHGHGVEIKDNRIFSNLAFPCFRKPQNNIDYWENKIIRNQHRDKEEQKKLAEMGWHCITVWECNLKPLKRLETLNSIAFTLNHIWLQDHQVQVISHPQEIESRIPMAAELLEPPIKD